MRIGVPKETRTREAHVSAAKAPHVMSCNEALVKGIDVEGGKIVHPALQGMKL